MQIIFGIIFVLQLTKEKSLMKKRILTTVTIMMLFGFNQISNAQNDKKTIKIPKQNIIKLNLPSLLVSNISLQYERIMGKHTSLALGVRWMPKNNVGFTSSILGSGVSASDDSILNQVRISSFAITPEFRYYVRKAGKGFYIAPYFRFRNANANFPIFYKDGTGVEQRVILSGSVNSLMLGFMIGSQFKLSKSLTLDWFIIGGHTSSNQAKLNFTSTQNLSATNQADIKKNLEDFKKDLSDAGFKTNNISYSVGTNGGSLVGKMPMSGFRAFGLCLGYRF
jgi:hypothetical protein